MLLMYSILITCIKKGESHLSNIEKIKAIPNIICIQNNRLCEFHLLSCNRNVYIYAIENNEPVLMFKGYVVDIYKHEESGDWIAEVKEIKEFGGMRDALFDC